MMNRRLDALFRALILTAFAPPLLSSSAAAQEEPRGASFELFGGASAIYTSDRGLSVHTDSFGVRGGFHLTHIWTVEAQLSQSRHDRLLLNGQVSAKAYLFQRDRFRFFALAGPGIQYEHVAGDTGISSTVHAGIGAEIDLTAKTYLRPEVRAGWYSDHLSSTDHSLDYTLGFGWRF
jgi:Outer membrane protein beta-barrel domain